MYLLPPKSIHTRERLAQPGLILAGVDDILRRLGDPVGPFKRDTVNDFVISHVFDPSVSSLRRHLGVAVNLGLDGLTLQLFFLRRSESIGNHDSEIVDADADSVG
jgi:hypothetical protein